MTPSFDRDDIPRPTACDTILEILGQGRPKADTEIFALSESMSRGHTLGRIKVARARLIERGMVIPAAGFSLIPTGNGRCAKRYRLA